MAAILAASAAAGARCALPPAIDPTWTEPGHVLVLGEVHRTRECPRAAAEMLCAISARRPVVLALEIWSSEQPRIDAFLANGDAPALLAGAFWQRAPGDGRESEAMLELIQRARELRLGGAAVTVRAIDSDPDGDRDRGMARSVEEARKSDAKAVVLVLVGNAHASKRLAVHKPLGWHLANDGVPLASINLVPGSLPADGFDRELDLGRFSESPRAREAAHF